MPFADYLLYRIARPWPSPVARRKKDFGAEPGTEAYAMAYALWQFNLKVREGVAVPPLGLEVLEIGCGHGGISCYLAAVGAKHVTGIDLNTINLQHARRFAGQLSERLGRELPVTFAEMDATHLAVPEQSLDLVVADNVFEHFTDHNGVLREVMRVLRPGGKLLVPVFSSIYSKYGLHLKHGLKLPWANLFFSEQTICRAMQRLARDNPQLYETYPGLKDNPTRVRDVRRYHDLNDLTYKQFKRDAEQAGYRIEWFRPSPTSTGRIISRVPGLKRSFLMDILSKGAGCLLVKPGDERVETSRGRCAGSGNGENGRKVGELGRI
jgi:ubiquinone/menaquinone biosynthesis C-methylase UbiE